MRLEQTRATLVSRITQHVPLALAGLVRVVGEGPYALSLGGAEGGLPMLWQVEGVTPPSA